MKGRTLFALVLCIGVCACRSATTHEVDMVGFAFSPAEINAQVSDSVRWTMRDGMFVQHTSTSGQDGIPNGLWDSGPMETGATFIYTFNTTGTFPYFCQPHSFSIIGSVTVSGGTTPPMVSITSPANGANFFGPTNLTIQASASDPGGSVTRVQFFDGASSVGFDTTSPYSVATYFSIGSRSLTAVATDNLGVRATSAPVNITVRSIPAPVATRVTNVAVAGSNLNAIWRDGAGPFALQKKSTLNDPMWVNSAFSATRNSSAPAVGQGSFFRISDTANQPAIPLTVILSGAAERPAPVSTTATGSGTFALEGHVLSFNIRYSGLSANSTGAHIHGPASAAEATGVLIDFAPFHTAGSTSGTISGSVVLTAVQKSHILAGRTYVNVHSTLHPNGEIRGQIAPVLYQTFLNGANERPNPVNTPGIGLGTFALVGNQLSFVVSYRNLTETASGAHIHGPADENQSTGVMIDFQPYNGGAYGSSGNVGGTVTLTPAQLAALVDGLTYANFHTSANPPGEIRGQIRPQTTAVPLTAHLSGLNERPTPVTNSASGSAILSLEGNILHFNMRYAGLSGAASAAHIHGPGTAAQSVGVMIDLARYHLASGNGGTISGAVLLTASQRSNILSGFTYVNVHTAANPSGEIRGHVAPVLMTTRLSGGDERPNRVDTLGTGSGHFTLAGNQLGFHITYRDLTGAASAAHIHGPATTSQTAGVMIDFAPFNGGSFGVSGAVAGMVTLTAQQFATVVDGLTYANFHTATNGGGEIRGQIVR